MATQIRNQETKEIDNLVNRLTLLINSGKEINTAAPIIKRNSNVFSLYFNVNKYQPHLPLVEGCKSRVEFIVALRNCINTLKLSQAIWHDAPIDIVDEYLTGKV
jgi:hypothetical protein